MTLMRRLTLPSTLALAGLLAGCATHATPAAPAPPPPPPVVVEPPVVAAPPPKPVEVIDPVVERLKSVDREFASGQSELALGHLVAAREAFDRAVDLLLAAPGGARSEPRLESAYQRVLDQITALEAIALREGDGFTAAKSEPAALDVLLNGPEPVRLQPLATTKDTVAADLARTPHDLTIPLNNKVLGYIELFQGNLHDFMAASLERGSRYVPMIRDVFGAAGLPLDLAYVPVVESAFQSNALSRASAKGMWQFMLGTGLENGLTQTWFVDDRSDPEKATRAAAQYLKSLVADFNGDWNLALASYNAGPGTLERAMRRSKLTDYWQLTATSKYLPKETREYVPMILAAIVIAANPTQYGFEAPNLMPLLSERVTVPDALDLRLIAEWTGVSVDEIRELNPELRRGTTPVGKHEMRVPIGTAAAVEAKLAAADQGVFVKFNTYTVKSGDTLAAIARKFKVRAADLAQSNQLKTTSRINEGQTLLIPRDPTATAALTQVPAPPPATTHSTPVGGQTVTTYRVKAGDTLTSIAKLFDTTVQALKQLNRLTTDTIVVGDKLTVRR